MMDVQRTHIRARHYRRHALVGGAVIGILLLAWVAVGMASRPPVADAELLWNGQVRRGEFIHEVSAAGSLIAPEIRTVTNRTDGVVERVLVLPGQEVRSEDVLVELSSTSIGGDLQRARSELTAAEADA